MNKKHENYPSPKIRAETGHATTLIPNTFFTTFTNKLVIFLSGIV